MFLFFGSLALVTLLALRVNAATTPATTVQAESLVYTRDGIKTDKSTVASMSWTSFGVGTFTVPQDVNSLAVTAKATLCAGGPEMVVHIDGKKVLSHTVESTDMATTTVPIALAKGTHNIVLSFLNDYATDLKTCDRNLIVDKLEFYAPGVTPPASTPTPAPATPTPVAPVSSTSRLRWAPPALTAPETKNVAATTAAQTFNLTAGKDYILKFPQSTVGGITIVGGRNVTMIGGQIKTITGGQHGIYIKDTTGTVHIEGVTYDGSGGRETDAIAITAPQATVQIQNVRLMGVRGSQSGWHGDIVQPWGGVKALRIDRLTGSTNYQGLFLRPDIGPIGSIALSNIDIKYDNVAPNNGGYLLWFTTGCNTAPATISEVYLTPPTGRSLGKAVWPDVANQACPVTLAGAGAATTAKWTTIPVTGVVKTGLPAGGSFVPVGVAGNSYKTPGYN